MSMFVTFFTFTHFSYFHNFYKKLISRKNIYICAYAFRQNVPWCISSKIVS